MTGAGRSRASKPPWRRTPADSALFPVTPMLDMAFQLLAFLILTFRVPSSEASLDLILPLRPPDARDVLSRVTGVALDTAQETPRSDRDRVVDIQVRAEANTLGRLVRLSIGGTVIDDERTLPDRLRRYARLLDGRPLRVTLVADNGLVLADAARLMGRIQSLNAVRLRLASPPQHEHSP